MKIRIFIIVSCLFWANMQLIAQDCSQNLVDAKRAYFNGGFQEVLDLLEVCKNQFERTDEKREALELLCNTHLVLDHQVQADSTMEELLRLDPLYKSRSTDLAEFQDLYESYEIRNRFNLGLVIGLNDPDFQVMQYRSYASDTREGNDMNSSLGPVLGLRFDYRIIEEFYLSLGAYYQNNSYEKSELLLGFQDLYIKENLHFINIPLQIQYLFTYKDFQVFLNGGISAHILMKSSADIELFGRESPIPTPLNGVPEKADNYNLTEQRNRLNFNYIFGGGIRRKFGLTAIELGINYEYGLNNLSDSENRYTDENLYKTYSYVSDDFKMDQWVFSIGVVRSFVKPQKARK